MTEEKTSTGRHSKTSCTWRPWGRCVLYVRTYCSHTHAQAHLKHIAVSKNLKEKYLFNTYTYVEFIIMCHGHVFMCLLCVYHLLLCVSHVSVMCQSCVSHAFVTCCHESVMCQSHVYILS